MMTDTQRQEMYSPGNIYNGYRNTFVQHLLTPFSTIEDSLTDIMNNYNSNMELIHSIENDSTIDWDGRNRYLYDTFNRFKQLEYPKILNIIDIQTIVSTSSKAEEDFNKSLEVSLFINPNKKVYTGPFKEHWQFMPKHLTTVDLIYPNAHGYIRRGKSMLVITAICPNISMLSLVTNFLEDVYNSYIFPELYNEYSSPENINPLITKSTDLNYAPIAKPSIDENNATRIAIVGFPFEFQEIKINCSRMILNKIQMKMRIKIEGMDIGHLLPFMK